MKRILLLTLLLIGHISFSHLKSQTLSDDDIHQKLQLISDSIDIYQEQGNAQKVLSVCEDGIIFLSNNDLYYTPPACMLNLIAGESCMSLGNYYKAKKYFYTSFIFDEFYDFGIGVYQTIAESASTNDNISDFKALLDFAKSDTIYFNLLATDPDKLGYILNELALDDFNKGEFQSAIYFFELELCLLDALGKTGNEDYLGIIPIEIICITQLGNYELAKSIADYYLDLVEVSKGNKTIVYAEALQTKAYVEKELGNYNKEIELYNESLSLIESIKGKNNMDYIRCLSKIGLAYQRKDDNYIEWLKICLESEKLLELTADATIDDKLINLQYISNIFDLMGDNANSLNYAEKAFGLLETEGQTSNVNYAIALSNLSMVLCNNHSYIKAIEIGEKAVYIFSQIYRTYTQEQSYRQAISTLSSVYFESGNIEKAISTLRPLLSEDVPDDENKLIDFHRIATFYQRAGLNIQLKECLDASLRLAERIEGKKSALYADALLFAATIQEKDGDAVLMLQEAANIYLQLYGENSEGYIRIQKQLSLTGTRYKTFDSKKDMQDSLLDNYKNLYGEDNRKYLHEYVNMLRINGEQFIVAKDIENLYYTTLQLDSLSQNIRTLFSGNDDLYIFTRNTLAQMVIDCYEMTADTTFYNKGVEIQNEVVNLALSLYGKNNIKYINQIANLAYIKSCISNLYYLTHQDESDTIHNLFFKKEQGPSEAWEYYESTLISKCYVEIQELQRQVVDYYIQFGGCESSKYAQACNDLAAYYLQEISNFPISDIFMSFHEQGDVVQSNLDSKLRNAELLLVTALDIYKRAMDFESAADILINLCILYEESHEDVKLFRTLNENFKLWKDNTLKQMSLMTADEKSQMVFDDSWQAEIAYYSSRAYYKSKQKTYNSKFAELSYDVQLLTKGLLLKSEIALRDLILDTGDSIIINKFNRLSDIKKLLSNSQKESDRDALNREYQQLERLLMKESELYGNYLHGFSYTFNDVKASLGKNDVAIEFATTRHYENVSWFPEYFALVLKHDYSSPKVIPIKNEFNSDSIYQQVWEPLFEEIKGAENVYFSPTHDLNNLPLESAKMPDGSYISDLGINFYRVSSTREIIRQHRTDAYKTVVLYGGLNYDTDVETLITSDAEERSKGLRGIGNMSDDIENDLRRGNIIWKYLNGTKIEVEDIEKVALNLGIKTKLFSASNGTESTLKNLSGKKTDIIHIATHGFYIKPFDSKNEENQMERSGLALAGANNKQKGKALPKGVDDGILTADEISRLDLRGTDLIVLSACETGLGDVTGEGVYGLQRGFKKAGVNSIVMSLWKVDDDATRLLMTDFYNHLFSGYPKIEALKKAQTYVRMQKGYEDPYYWSGFILLDGLN